MKTYWANQETGFSPVILQWLLFIQFKEIFICAILEVLFDLIRNKKFIAMFILAIK